MEEIQRSNETQFAQLNANIAQLLQRSSPSPSSSHGGRISGCDQPRSSFQVRSVKLDFPRFDGKNVMDWIFKAEQFFDYYATPDCERLLIASVHLDHDVVPWYQMIQKTNPFLTWSALTRALELDFGPSAYDFPRATLFKLQQSGSVNDYYMQFTSLVNRVDGLSFDAILDCFISGLQDEISRDVKAMEPRNLSKVVALAKLFEEKYAANKTKISSTPAKNYNPPSSFTSKTQTATQRIDNSSKSTLPPLLPTPAVKPFNIRNQNIKRISPAEIQLRREKNLCYFCDEKFSPAHKCPNRQVMLLQLTNEDDSQSDTTLVFDEELTVEEDT
ncbi:hypothetical protein A2U01_0019212, partial [Trifolium medium]|nr:hypothetical protein [Trifolium medium]